MTGRLFSDSHFTRLCIAPNDADRITPLLPEPDPLWLRMLVVGERQLVALAPISIVGHGAQVEPPMPFGILLVVEISATTLRLEACLSICKLWNSDMR